LLTVCILACYEHRRIRRILPRPLIVPEIFPAASFWTPSASPLR
jgi:hypothetical protein